MREKDIVKFIDKKVKVKFRHGKEYIGELWGITLSFESTSGKNEIDLSIDGEDLELGAPIDDIVSIRVVK